MSQINASEIIGQKTRRDARPARICFLSLLQLQIGTIKRGHLMNRFKHTAKTLLTCADTGSISTLDEFWSEIEIGFPIFSSNSSSVEIEPISAQVSNVLAVFKSIHSPPPVGAASISLLKNTLSPNDTHHQMSPGGRNKNKMT